MEAVHRDILRKNHSGLVQAIPRVEDVVDKLMQFKVLTSLMEADIIEKPQTSFDRVRALLDTLPRRGPQAYSLFCKALEECGEIQAMTLLGLETELQDPHCHTDLGNDVFVTAKMWNGELGIHVRKDDVYASGRSYPTTRGIVLSLKHWLELCGVHFMLQEAIHQGRTHDYAHVGANMYATLDPNGSVDLRQSEKNEQLGRVVPTAKGILLSNNGRN
ncbi:uncharacterized protein LOC124256767 [Haliotis rubra]|uniref:uncharacterized protein LOC124256767 n=1 Tax=Haliotis rubra TaxID=36100 RepID=UPI001EE503F4|nr:uncharacterized protein LOC124256767 [Haliotis rubra]